MYGWDLFWGILSLLIVILTFIAILYRITWEFPSLRRKWMGSDDHPYNHENKDSK